MLRELPVAGRIGMTFLLLTLAMGLLASARHLFDHHEARDEQPGLSLTDIEGAYHGTRTHAPLRGALERDHPESLPQSDREALLAWLDGDSLSEAYDSLEATGPVPADLLDQHCISCHSRQASEAVEPWLDYWDDVAPLAQSRQVEPTDPKILIASAHTHALGMGSLSVVLAGLALIGRWPRRPLGLLILLSGVGLFVDLLCWWLARESSAFVLVLAVSGSVWMFANTMLIAGTLLDLWWPKAQS